jgi:Reverse transcriptase (RNA-dependent DNA polymerase)
VEWFRAVFFAHSCFLLYINDVVEVFRDSKCTCKLYADDLKIYTEIQLVDDLNLLQSALDALYEWSDRWQLSISYKKCSAILINVPEQTEGVMPTLLALDQTP